MSRRLSGILLFLILLVNLIVIISVEIDRHKDDKDKNNDNNDNVIEESQDENDQNGGDTEAAEDENSDNGKIDDGGLFVQKAEASGNDNAAAIEKSRLANITMNQTGRWITTDYAYGDISTDKWTVLRGDTLWEISEAKYGTGRQWTSILHKNQSQIGFLPDHTQALILPGQVLLLK